jgi:hypothetical protein
MDQQADNILITGSVLFGHSRCAFSFRVLVFGFDGQALETTAKERKEHKVDVKRRMRGAGVAQLTRVAGGFSFRVERGSVARET